MAIINIEIHTLLLTLNFLGGDKFDITHVVYPAFDNSLYKVAFVLQSAFKPKLFQFHCKSLMEVILFCYGFVLS